MTSSLSLAARAVRDAKYLLFTAGAGMGVDSGLPDFRGNEGFWRAYPPFQRLGLKFEEVADPHWFVADPQLAWGFYGHRFNLYRATTPHRGFQILKRWPETKLARVYTSNVDGHFQRSGFAEEDVCEVHGSLLHLQCVSPCSNAIWDAADLKIEIDETTFRAKSGLPHCPYCGALARPNVLMFGDGQWCLERSGKQESRLFSWLRQATRPRLTVVEMGAGTAIPTVRRLSESLAREGATLVRINPRESFGPTGTLSLEMGAKEGLEAIDALLSET